MTKPQVLVSYSIKYTPLQHIHQFHQSSISTLIVQQLCFNWSLNNSNFINKQWLLACHFLILILIEFAFFNHLWVSLNLTSPIPSITLSPRPTPSNPSSYQSSSSFIQQQNIGDSTQECPPTYDDIRPSLSLAPDPQASIHFTDPSGSNPVLKNHSSPQPFNRDHVLTFYCFSFC
jgi:hypothetical protein